MLLLNTYFDHVDNILNNIVRCRKNVVYMISVKVICVGRLKEPFYTDAASEYAKRLGGYCKLDIIEIPEHRLPDKPSDTQIILALEKESEAVCSRIPAGHLIVALCVEGKEMDSFELAGFLADSAGHGASRLCFIIGGSHGLHISIKDRADFILSMSKMTFPHNLARVMVLEQLYRAFSINEGGKYHK